MEKIKFIVIMGLLGFAAIVVASLLCNLILRLFLKKDQVKSEVLFFLIVAWIALSFYFKISSEFCLSPIIGALVAYFLFSCIWEKP